MTRAKDSRGAVDGAASCAGVTENAPERQPRTVRLPALLVTMEAASLAMFSGLHLSGAIHVGGRSGAANGAGIVEALIGVVLLVAAFTLIRWPGAGRRIGLPSLAFAIAGFIVGLTFTARGGQAVDLIYHVVMLPVLILTTLALLRAQPASP